MSDNMKFMSNDNYVVWIFSVIVFMFYNLVLNIQRMCISVLDLPYKFVQYLFHVALV